jgi:hypothetical protein
MKIEIRFENEILFENDYSAHVVFGQWRFIEIGYETVNLCQKQHTFTFVLLGLGVSIWWKGPLDEKCRKRLDRDLWGDEPQIKKKKRYTKKSESKRTKKGV